MFLCIIHNTLIVETFRNGDSYRGSFKRDKYNGEGTLESKAGVYVGSFLDGYKDGNVCICERALRFNVYALQHNCNTMSLYE